MNFKVALEVLPQFEIGEFSDIALERPVADVEESEVEPALRAPRRQPRDLSTTVPKARRPRTAIA